MANKQLPEFLTAENNLDGQEPVYIAQGGKTRKTLLSKIKDFIIGTTALTTTDKTVTGSIEEINKKATDNAIQLKDYVNDSGWINVPVTENAKQDETYPFQYRKIGKVVYFRGRITFTYGKLNTLANIPVGFRPLTAATRVCSLNDNTANYAYFTIDSNGAITCTATTRTAEGKYNMDGLSCLID